MNKRGSVPTVGFGDDWHDYGGESGPSIQRNYLLVIVHLGEVDASFHGQHCVISPGSVGLIPPGPWAHYRYSPRHRTHHTWCWVATSAMPASLRKRLATLPHVQTRSPIFELLMKATFSLRAWRKIEDREMIATLGLTLFQEYARMAGIDADEAKPGSPCDRARHYLEEHCGEKDCLKGAARAAGITQQHLIRLFRQQYRITPGRYLWQTRVERGATLLAATGLTAAEISDRCGFKNPFHFSRLLRKMQGLSPRQFRQSMSSKSSKSSSPKSKPAHRRAKPAGSKATGSKVKGR